MIKLRDIQSLWDEQIDLLEAVGVTDAIGLAESQAEVLHSEIVKANQMLVLVAEVPSVDAVKSWVEEASRRIPQGQSERDLLARGDNTEDEKLKVSQAGLASAKALSENALKEAGLLVADIPPASAVDAPRESNPDKNITSAKAVLPSSNSQDRRSEQLAVNDIDEPGDSNPVDLSRVQSIEEVQEGATRRVEPLKRKSRSKVNSVNKKTNRGVSRDSRRYVKGVLHTLPTRLRVGAFLVLLIPFVLFLGFLSLGSVFMGIWPEEQRFFGVIGFILMPIAGLILLLIASRPRCQVCGQRQFMPKKTRKNKKAHHVPVLGHIIPTAIHALLFKWFYCIFCGTANRLKE